MGQQPISFSRMGLQTVKVHLVRIWWTTKEFRPKIIALKYSDCDRLIFNDVTKTNVKNPVVNLIQIANRYQLNCCSMEHISSKHKVWTLLILSQMLHSSTINFCYNSEPEWLVQRLSSKGKLKGCLEVPVFKRNHYYPDNWFPCSKTYGNAIHRLSFRIAIYTPLLNGFVSAEMKLRPYSCPWCVRNAFGHSKEN